MTACYAIYCSTRTSIYERQTVWGLIVGQCVTWIVLFGCSPQAAQRIGSIQSQKKAKMLVNILHSYFHYITKFLKFET